MIHGTLGRYLSKTKASGPLVVEIESVSFHYSLSFKGTSPLLISIELSSIVEVYLVSHILALEV